MFWVFAINETAEREKFTRQRSNYYAALVRNNKIAGGDVPERLAADVDEHMQKVRAKPLHEFAMPSSAEQYADVLRATSGFREISIKARILAPPQQGRCQAFAAVGIACRIGRRRLGRTSPAARLAGRQCVRAARGAGAEIHQGVIAS